MTSFLKAVAVACVFALASTASSAITYDEAVQGDLSDSSTAPTSLGVLGVGTNDLFQRAITPGDPDDFFSFTVASGQALSSITVGQYLHLANTNNGSNISFAGNGLSGNLQIPTNLPSGTELLAALAGGPLLAGTYTFWINAPGSVIESHLEFNVTPVPVPASGILLLSMLGLGVAAHRRARRKA